MNRFIELFYKDKPFNRFTRPEIQVKVFTEMLNLYTAAVDEYGSRAPIGLCSIMNKAKSKLSVYHFDSQFFNREQFMYTAYAPHHQGIFWAPFNDSAFEMRLSYLRFLVRKTSRLIKYEMSIKSQLRSIRRAKRNLIWNRNQPKGLCQLLEEGVTVFNRQMCFTLSDKVRHNSSYWWPCNREGNKERLKVLREMERILHDDLLYSNW